VAYTAGKMKKSQIKTLVGDRVTVEMSPYDVQKGRLIFRVGGATIPNRNISEKAAWTPASLHSASVLKRGVGVAALRTFGNRQNKAVLAVLS
jgi:Translation initiation factor 1A / IF-1